MDADALINPDLISVRFMEFVLVLVMYDQDEAALLFVYRQWFQNFDLVRDEQFSGNMEDYRKYVN